MDKYEEFMKKADNKKNLEEWKNECSCPMCPSYNDCAKKGSETLYCFTGKSAACIRKENGCICMMCPVYEEIELRKSFYCTRGTETEQRQKK